MLTLASPGIFNKDTYFFIRKPRQTVALVMVLPVTAEETPEAKSVQNGAGACCKML